MSDTTNAADEDNLVFDIKKRHSLDGTAANENTLLLQSAYVWLSLVDALRNDCRTI